MERQKCYICDTETVFYCKDVYKLHSKYSETPILQFLERFIDRDFDLYRSNEDKPTKIVCQNCIIKLDDYDLACEQCKTIEGEFKAMLIQTELANYPQVCAFTNSNENWEDSSQITSEMMLEINKEDPEFIIEDYLSPSEDEEEAKALAEVKAAAVKTVALRPAKIDKTPVKSKKSPTTKPAAVRAKKSTTPVPPAKENNSSTRQKEKDIKTKKVEPKDPVKRKEFEDLSDEFVEMKCAICRVVFPSFVEFVAHEHLKNQIKWNEPEIEMVFSKDAEGNMIMKKNGTTIKKILKKKIKKIDMPDIVDAGNVVDVPQVAFRCEEFRCTNVFPTEKLLEKHKKQHHGKVMCEICAVKFDTIELLDEHRLRHEGINPLHCIECGKEFTKRGPLTRHMPIHTGEKFYQCDTCGKEFLHHSSFRFHLMAHQNIRTKKCPDCDLVFRSNSHLKQHQLVHSGAKPHACPVCHQKFAQKYNMTAHLSRHNNVPDGVKTKRKVHPCLLCTTMFSRASKLVEHYVKVHDRINGPTTD